ncbi:MAG: S1 RNA-binding domain-containing protein [Oscillospiraceae bacterium]|jgi:S1 RNA binding domain protein|nr:S1 RNA-binding domain-containing protein [Oscillospiraceae bacterium]
MQLEVGEIHTGKVTGITKFGAFVELAPGQSGLVHISEIANSYVSDVADFLAAGQEVTVKVIGLADGKINLSVKQAAPPEPRSEPQSRRYTPQGRAQTPPEGEPSFEDKLSRFLKDSAQNGSKSAADKRGKRKR